MSHGENLSFSICAYFNFFYELQIKLRRFFKVLSDVEEAQQLRESNQQTEYNVEKVHIIARRWVSFNLGPRLFYLCYP